METPEGRGEAAQKKPKKEKKEKKERKKKDRGILKL